METIVLARSFHCNHAHLKSFQLLEQGTCSAEPALPGLCFVHTMPGIFCPLPCCSVTLTESYGERTVPACRFPPRPILEKNAEWARVYKPILADFFVHVVVVGPFFHVCTRFYPLNHPLPVLDCRRDNCAKILYCYFQHLFLQAHVHTTA